MMLTARDLQGVYAIIPTPAKDGAERWDALDTVDLDETARLVEQLIRDGAAGIIALGTTGECATLTSAEYDAFADCLLSTVRRRVPVFVGTTALGTHEIARRHRFVRERGADGVLLGLPMWQPATMEIAVAFYSELSSAFPDLAIMVYANPGAFRFAFPVAFWKLIADRAPTVIAAKTANSGLLLPALAASRGRINFLPIDVEAYAYARLSPETTTACWSTAASMGPEPAIAQMDALAASNWEQARAILADLAWANETFLPPGGMDVFASYNLQLEKIRMQEAGYCRPGPIRPPYNLIPKELAENARQCGRRWAQLRDKYRRPVA